MTLPVPPESLTALHVCDTDAHRHDRAETCVRAIAAPVVVAVLRELASEVDPWRVRTDGAQRYRDGWFDGSSMVFDHLCDRADQIERDTEENR